MTTAKSMTIALCLAVLPGLSASAAIAPGPSPQGPPTDDTQTAQPNKDDMGAKDEKDQKDEKTNAEVKGYILGAAFGIQTGDAAANVLHQISSSEPMQKGDLRKIAGLAEDAVDAAKRSTKRLNDMKTLPDGEKADAKAAMDKLEEAHATVKKIKRQVGVIEGEFRKDAAENVRTDAMQLHAQLGDAHEILEKIADAHQLSIELAFPPRSAARSD